MQRLRFRVSDASSTHRAIPSLDGLRAIAIGTVLVSHFKGWAILPLHGPVHTVLNVAGQAQLGVHLFFIISGFLITTLLLNERNKTSRIDIKAFYFRRAFRIFPAYYVYLLIAAAVALVASRAIPWPAFLSAAGYFSDYYPYRWIHPPINGWYVAQTWSLSVEEQFYLLWPLILSRLPVRRAVGVCVATLVVVPLLRVATMAFAPVYGMEEQWYRLFHTTADTMALGCLLALVAQQPEQMERLKGWLRPWLVAVGTLYLCVYAGVANHAPQWLVGMVLLTAANLALGAVMLYAVLHPAGWFGRLLNWQPMRYAGVISYSLYLWNQMFLGPFTAPTRWWDVAAVFAAAALSYHLVERPMLRLRNRIEPRLFERSAVSRG